MSERTKYLSLEEEERGRKGEILPSRGNSMNSRLEECNSVVFGGHYNHFSILRARIGGDGNQQVTRVEMEMKPPARLSVLSSLPNVFPAKLVGFTP